MPEDEKERKELLENYSVIMKKVKEVLEDKESLEDILTKFPKELETSAAQAIAGRMQRIDAVLEKAGFITEEEKMQYQESLEYSPSGCQIVMARDIDEIWVNSYNPEITEAFDANTDFQICCNSPVQALSINAPAPSLGLVLYGSGYVIHHHPPTHHPTHPDTNF